MWRVKKTKSPEAMKITEKHREYVQKMFPDVEFTEIGLKRMTKAMKPLLDLMDDEDFEDDEDW